MAEVKQRKRRRLNLEINNPDEKNMPQDAEEINKRIFKVFKHHIGKGNSITAYDLFTKIFGVAPEHVDVFKREYLWRVLKQILTNLRSNELLFVVNNNHDYYVLQSENELIMFKDKMDRVIDALHKTKNKADSWVKNKKWRTL